MQRLTKNPLIHLAVLTWRNAKGIRPLIVLYIALACGAIGIELCKPILIGKIMNGVQNIKEAKLDPEIWQPLLLFFLSSFVFWMLHGPSRVIERLCRLHRKDKLSTKTLLPDHILANKMAQRSSLR